MSVSAHPMPERPASPPDRPEVTDRQIEETAAQMAADATDREWLETLCLALDRVYDPGTATYPRSEHDVQRRAQMLTGLRAAVDDGHGDRLLDAVRYALSQEWLARAEEDLTC